MLQIIGMILGWGIIISIMFIVNRCATFSALKKYEIWKLRTQTEIQKLNNPE